MRIQAKCEQVFRVCEPCSVKIMLTCGETLKPGDRVQVQFPNSWSMITGPSFTREFQSADASKAHFVSVCAGEDARFNVAIQPRHLNYPEGAVRHGRLITAELAAGFVPAGAQIEIRYDNTVAPYVAETETVWLRVNGHAPEQAPVLRTLAGPNERFRLIAPSCARPGEQFDLLVVSLDRFDDASSTEFQNERITSADGTTVAEGLSFTGSCRVPVRIAQAGVFRFRFRETVSNAVRVAETVAGPYWGDLHIHTKLSHDGQGRDPYAYCREVSGLDFGAAADHWESLGPEGYRILMDWAEAANVPGKFVAIPADERNPKELMGHHNIYFRDVETMRRHMAVQRKPDDPPANAFAAIQYADPASVMLIPHHTGICWNDMKRPGEGMAVDLDCHDDKGMRPVMEIYSHHGQSELYCPQHLLAYEYNRMRNPERRANTSMPGPYYAQNYWMRGRRIGVIASSDEHSGQGGRSHGGIAAVFADNLTRESIFDSIRRRRCYATTGERMLVDFSVGGLRMGESGRKSAGETIPVRLDVWGTDTLLRVEILRYRPGVDSQFTPILSTAPRPEGMDFSICRDEHLDASAIYYARVTQAPLAWPAMAWTSPVWVDIG